MHVSPCVSRSLGRPGEDTRTPVVELTGGCELPHSRREQTLGFLPEQQVLLTLSHPPAPQGFYFNF